MVEQGVEHGATQEVSLDRRPVRLLGDNLRPPKREVHTIAPAGLASFDTAAGPGPERPAKYEAFLSGWSYARTRGCLQ